MSQVARVTCCAILELHGLHDRGYSYKADGVDNETMVKRLLEALFKHYIPGGPLGHNGSLPDQIYSRPYIILSYATVMSSGKTPQNQANGEAFIAWNKEHGMGTTIVTEPHENPSSHSQMVFILWMPDHKKLRQYFIDNFVTPAWNKKLEDEKAAVVAQTLAAKVAAKNAIPGKTPDRISSTRAGYDVAWGR